MTAYYIYAEIAHLQPQGTLIALDNGMLFYAR